MPPRIARKRPLERPKNPRPKKRVATTSDCLMTSSHLPGNIDNEKSVSQMNKVDSAVAKHLKAYRLSRDKFDKLEPDQKVNILSDIFRLIVIQSDDKLDPNLHKMIIDDEYADKWDAFVEAHPGLNDILLEGWSSDPPTFNKVLELEYLQKPEPQPAVSKISFDSRVDYLAAISSWSAEFRGDSAKLLHTTLKSYIQHKSDLPYARYAVLLQSSGTGKSRMNDELAKSIIYIPVNLAVRDRSPSRIVCPPSDHRKFQNWFWLKSKVCLTQQKSRAHYEGLVFGLMTVTKRCLEEIEQSDDAIPGLITIGREKTPQYATLRRLSLLAVKFRSKMSIVKGCRALEYEKYRETFYDDVIAEAEKFISSARESNRAETPGALHHVEKAASQQPHGRSVEEAGNALREFLDPLKLCAEEPLLVICFDDANSLTDPIGGQSFTHFSELRHALRPLNTLPFFSLFVSTGGQAHEVSPDSWTYDPSNRCQMEVLNLFPPITEVGFDDFAVRVPADGSWTLDRLASTHHIAHLGRALFPARYDHSALEHRVNIVNFAHSELLQPGRPISSLPLSVSSDDQKLACLDVRLSLDFRGTHWIDRAEECNQVANHARLCLSATRGFKDMFTVAPSEPLLAEAASLGMTSWGAAKALVSHIKYSHLDAGGGEVVVALLALLARDTALQTRKPPLDPPTASKIPKYENRNDLTQDGAHRVVRVIDFLEALLSESCHEQLRCHTPSDCLNLDASTATLEDSFKNAHIWFNHFIKVHTLDVIDEDHLWHYLVRGAAIICANNQGGIDILIPILHNNRLRKENVSAILVQVKTDPFYKASITSDTFERMNPLSRVFSEKLKSPPPIIRMVFALASDTPAIRFGPPASTRPTSRGPNTQLEARKDGLTSKCTTYDIWCAGVSSETFRVIHEHENYIYQELLLLTRNSYDPYSPGSYARNKAERATARRAMHAGGQPTLEHHQRFAVEAMD